jgi:CHAT domain-containing protein
MNLWRASDKVASELMTEFYRRWLGGRTKADALRDAMLLAKAHARQRFGTTDPYMWCGFVLVGDCR